MSLRPCHCISQPRLWPSWPTRSWRKSHLSWVECYNRQGNWHFNHLESTWCFFVQSLQSFLKQSWVFEWDGWIDSVLTSDNSAWQRCIDVSLFTLHSSSHFDHGLSLHSDDFSAKPNGTTHFAVGVHRHNTCLRPGGWAGYCQGGWLWWFQG